MKLTVSQTKEMMLAVADGIIENVDFLTEADKMGDADHGTGMETGFSKVKEKLRAAEPASIGDVFKTSGTAIMMSSGGASGVIFGTLFRGGAGQLNDSLEFGVSELAVMLRGGLDAVVKRGGAKVGDKTMIDALEPAVLAVEGASGDDLTAVISDVYEAAKKGSDDTKDMTAAFGRMKTLGERTLGHPDPGSISMYLILRYMRDFIKK